MKTVSTLLAALITSAAAAPAIVWTGESSAQLHSSGVTGLRSLVKASAGSAVFFVIDRDENGSEGLTGLTTSGALPKVSSKYGEASSIHHSVVGIETIQTVAKELGSVTATTLQEYRSSTGVNEAAVNHDGKIAADIKLVTISNQASPAEIDSIVAAAIEDSSVGSVVLTSIRGLSEVKFERDLRAKKEFSAANRRKSRRRLDENGQYYGDAAAEVLYFVHFTPNIFSAFLFFLFFAAVTLVGIRCMGMIAGQEVYVTKYPTIGREA